MMMMIMMMKTVRKRKYFSFPYLFIHPPHFLLLLLDQVLCRLSLDFQLRIQLIRLLIRVTASNWQICPLNRERAQFSGKSVQLGGRSLFYHLAFWVHELLNKCGRNQSYVLSWLIYALLWLFNTLLKVLAGMWRHRHLRKMLYSYWILSILQIWLFLCTKLRKCKLLS